MKKKSLIFALLAVVVIVVLNLAVDREGRREGVFFAMGGIPVRVVAYDRTRAQFREDLRAVEMRVERLEDEYSRYRDGSDISDINRAGASCIEASHDVIGIVKRSEHWWNMTGGAFDVTVGPLVDLWKDAADKGKLPDARDIEAARSRVGMRHVRIDDADRVCLMKDGMTIDLGGIAKGAILDAVAADLEKRGAKRGIVDAGGDVAPFGQGPFTIGIQDPLNKGELLGVLTIPAGGVVTSGEYERYVTIGKKRYSHIIDPRTGMPAESLISVTVVGPNATDADALATALSVMGSEAAISLVPTLENFRAVIVVRNEAGEYEVWCSADLAELIELTPSWEGSLKTF